MTDASPYTPLTPQPSHGKRKLLIVVGVLLLLALLAFALRSVRMGREPVMPGAERPIDLPVESPEISTMEQVAAYTDGKPVPPPFPGITLPPIDEDDHVFGEQDALLSVVEYSNFGNRYANLLHQDLRNLVEGSDGEVNWIFRHYPLTVADYLPSQAAECAYFEDGHAGFWTFFNLTFKNVTPSKQSLVDVAASIGMDQTSFAECLDGNYTRDHVLIDVQDGRLSAQATISPSYLVVNNVSGDIRLVEGVNTIGYIEEVLDAVR